MTESSEIHLEPLARKFGGGDKDRAREWLKTLREAVDAGALEARIVKHTPRLPERAGKALERRGLFGEASSPEAPRRALALVSRYTTPAAVAAWLRTIKIDPPELVRAWLGESWQAMPREGQDAKATALALDDGSRLLKARGLELLAVDGNEWPDTLNADELARLWHPDDERTRDRMEAAISRAIGAGELRTDGTRQSRLSVIGTTFPTPGKSPAPAVSRDALRAWLGSDERPELVRAWLGDDLQAATPERDGKTDKIPGKLPRVAAGRLAVKAAWQIECETNRRASAKEVIARLQAWAENGNAPEILIESMPKKRAVKWLTAKGEERDYGLEACKKTLEAWHKSRQ